MRVCSSGDEDQACSRSNRSTQTEGPIRDGAVRASEVLHRTQRNLPADRSLLKIDRDKSSPRWRTTRQIGWRLQKVPKHSVGCSCLASVLSVLFIILHLRTRYQPDSRRKIIHIGDEQAVPRIKGIAAPGHAAKISRHGEGALDAGRRKDVSASKCRKGGMTRIAV